MLTTDAITETARIRGPVVQAAATWFSTVRVIGRFFAIFRFRRRCRGRPVVSKSRFLNRPYRVFDHFFCKPVFRFLPEVLKSEIEHLENIRLLKVRVIIFITCQYGLFLADNAFFCTIYIITVHSFSVFLPLLLKIKYWITRLHAVQKFSATYSR